MVCHRARSREARHLQRRVLDQVQGKDRVHRAFDRRTADLSVALGGVGVADGKKGSCHLDRQVEGRACGKIADVQVAAYAPWRNDGVEARLRSEEHTSELQSRGHLVCRLLLEKKTTTEQC